MKQVVRSIVNLLQTALNWLSNSPWASFALIFSLAFVIRVDALMKIPSRDITPNTKWELGAIAISLLKTGKFANPYMIPTGPTAHLPPVYPVIFSLIYRVFGLTPRAGYISLIFLIVAAAGLCALLPWFSKKIGLGGQAGVVAGVLGAIFVEWGGHGEYPSAIVMGLLLVTFLHRWTRENPSFIGSLLLGFWIGAAFHLQPALLPVILSCMVFELWWSKNRKKWIFSLLITLGILITCVPWGWRNYATFQSVFFIRSNFGLELRMGNHEGAYPDMEVMATHEKHLHPRVHFNEARKLREIGEITYMQGALDDALDWIMANPVEFLHLTGLRVLYIWFGPLHDPKAMIDTSTLTLLAFLGLWFAWKKISTPQKAVLVIPLVTYPLIYYLVAYMPRYRIPIDWILFILVGFALWQWIAPKYPQLTKGAT